MPTDLAEFHEAAVAEYDAAFDWYRERSPDAALRFDSEVDRALSRIIEDPQRWAIGAYSTRRFLLRHFPFTLIYREQLSAKIQIVALPTPAERLDIGGKGFRLVGHRYDSFAFLLWTSSPASQTMRCGTPVSGHVAG
jgi:plasmid stabilization system protein ParE